MRFGSIEIIYSDDDIVVVNKPTGISVSKDRSGAADLVEILEKQLSVTDLRIIHHLDKGCSGAMVLAKNLESQSNLCGMLERQQIELLDLALIAGIVPNDSGVINTPMARNRKNPRVMKIDPRGSKASTKWRMLADFSQAALIAAMPVTNRTHQVRLHLSDNGMPLAIDPLYGSTRPILLSEFKNKYSQKKGREERPLIDRLTLHCYQLTIPMSDSQTKTFVAGLDKNFAAAIKMLTKHNIQGPEAFLDIADFDRIIAKLPLDM